MNKSLIVFTLALLLNGWTRLFAGSMEEDFKSPPLSAGPYVWWHWMGSNISKEGITKDLESMKASGIGGATIFNLCSAVMVSKAPTKNLPFPDITYRSPKWWEMVEFATREAQRLGLEVGMHNCVGYSATGGPWVTPELSMQTVVFSVTPVEGGATFSGVLPKPKDTLDFYRDIAELAVPVTTPVDPKAILDLSKQMDKDGLLSWNAPDGKWRIYRFGHTSTGARPNPAPEEVKALEVDKMSASASKFHYEQVINPLREHLGDAMGKTFRHLTLDSYEAGNQDWTPLFREEFLKRKGYDPVPWLPLLDEIIVVENEKKKRVPVLTLGSPKQHTRFLWDRNDVIVQLYQQNNFEQGASIMHEAGLMMQFEPYGGPIDTIAAATVPDIPMGEFWTGKRRGIKLPIVASARAMDRKVVGAEALTGWVTVSKFSEDPAFLKIFGDAAYASGVTRLVLHHWVHQPFGDAFKPGMGMGWWGTHFGRNQTWAELGKAYFKYLARTQSLLQRGQGVGDFLTMDHACPDADAIPRAMLLRGDVRVENKQIVLPSGRRYAFLALTGNTMLPEVARKLKELVNQGATIVGVKPTQSPSLSGYPACDEEVRNIGKELWGNTDGRTKLENSVGLGKVFAGSPAQLMEKIGLTPPVISKSDPKTFFTAARKDGETDLFFIANGSDAPCDVTPSFRVKGKLPEIWQAEDGSHAPAPLWREADGRTEVPLRLRGKESLFVIFRAPAPAGDHPVSVEPAQGTTNSPAWSRSTNENGQPALLSSVSMVGEVVYASGKRVPLSVKAPPSLAVQGAWDVSFSPGMGAPEKIAFAELQSWSENSNPAIKYFSGTATYRKTINVPADLMGNGKRLILDLGTVSNLASVKINGIDLGVGWYAPFRFDATSALKPGENTLEIDVANTWANRLIGDEQEPCDVEWGNQASFGSDKMLGRPLVSYPDWFVKGQPRPSQGCKAFVTYNYFTKDSPLLPAGLLGPVKIISAQTIALGK